MLDFLKKSNEEAPVFLRVNTLKTNDKGCAEHLLKEGIKSSKVKENCLMLEERKNIFTSETFKNGFFIDERKSIAESFFKRKCRIVKLRCRNCGKVVTEQPLLCPSLTFSRLRERTFFIDY
jgi:hypothetical protein